MAYESESVYRSGGQWDREDANFDTSYDKDAWGTYYDRGKRYRDQEWWRDKHSRNNQHKRTYRSGTYEIDDENEDSFERWLKENQHKSASDIQQGRGTGGTFDYHDPNPNAAHDYSAADGSIVPGSTMREGAGGNSSATDMNSGRVPDSGALGRLFNRHGNRHLTRVHGSRLEGIKKRRNRWMTISGQAGSQMRAREEAKFHLKRMYGEQKRRRGTGWGG